MERNHSAHLSCSLRHMIVHGPSRCEAQLRDSENERSAEVVGGGWKEVHIYGPTHPPSACSLIHAFIYEHAPWAKTSPASARTQTQRTPSTDARDTLRAEARGRMRIANARRAIGPVCLRRQSAAPPRKSGKRARVIVRGWVLTVLIPLRGRQKRARRVQQGRPGSALHPCTTAHLLPALESRLRLRNGLSAISASPCRRVAAWVQRG